MSLIDDATWLQLVEARENHKSIVPGHERQAKRSRRTTDYAESEENESMRKIMLLYSDFMASARSQGKEEMALDMWRSL
jgi:hypothetical protein